MRLERDGKPPPRMTTPPHICIELVSNPLYLAGVRELVSSVAKRLGFNETNCSHLALAVDEALCNVMRHGYERRMDGPIWVRIEHEEQADGRLELRLTIEDEAKQVDPCTIRSRDLCDVRPGGLGVHIIKEVMDEAKYERREKAGMRLTLIKRQPSEAPCTQSCCVERPTSATLQAAMSGKGAPRSSGAGE